MKILENVDFVKIDAEFDDVKLSYGLRFNNFDGKRNILPVNEKTTIKDIIENEELILNHLKACEKIWTD